MERGNFKRLPNVAETNIISVKRYSSVSASNEVLTLENEMLIAPIETIIHTSDLMFLLDLLIVLSYKIFEKNYQNIFHSRGPFRVHFIME